MPDEIDEILDAQDEAEPKKRNRGTTRYLRKALVKLFAMSPEKLAEFQPRDTWDELALSLRKRALSVDKSYANTSFVVIRDTLGEKTGANSSDQPAAQQTGPALIDDLPRPVRSN